MDVTWYFTYEVVDILQMKLLILLRWNCWYIWKLLVLLGGSYWYFLVEDMSWCHQMDTFSVLLTLCAGNSPVTSEFPSQRPVMWIFYVFFDLHLNKRLSKKPCSCFLRCHCTHYDVTVMYIFWMKVYFGGNLVILFKGSYCYFLEVSIAISKKKLLNILERRHLNFLVNTGDNYCSKWYWVHHGAWAYYILKKLLILSGWNCWDDWIVYIFRRAPLIFLEKKTVKIFLDEAIDISWMKKVTNMEMLLNSTL